MSKLTVSDVIDEKLVEAFRLVQCMLEDFRAQNYGHAHDWIRHIDSAMSEYTDTHTDDAYSMLHDLLQSGNSGQPVTVHDGYVLVPVEPTDLMVEAMYRHPLSMRGALKAAISAAPKAPDGWIPVSERMPDKLIPVMVMYEDGDMWSAIWSGQFWDDGCAIPDPHSITHWRDMPDAPQGV